MKLGYKLWLSSDGKTFGDGPCELLERVGASGSIRKAAEEMGMSYSKAWGLVRRAEQQLNYPLLTKRTGGTLGGGSLLTAEATALIKRYRQFCSEADQALTVLYATYFDGE